MNLEGVDLPTLGGGLSILVVMVTVIRIAFKRLDTQDNAWEQLYEAAVRRAVAAETTLADLRKFVLDASERVEKVRKENEKKARENQLKMDEMKEELEAAKLQIQELQRWGEKR